MTGRPYLTRDHFDLHTLRAHTCTYIQRQEERERKKGKQASKKERKEQRKETRKEGRKEQTNKQTEAPLLIKKSSYRCKFQKKGVVGRE